MKMLKLPPKRQKNIYGEVAVTNKTCDKIVENPIHVTEAVVDFVKLVQQ